MRILAALSLVIVFVLPEDVAAAQRHRQLQNVQYGIASWYHQSPQRARRTASGERFDGNRLTAAHRTLPLGTEVKVTNLNNGRSVVVKINDRGPTIRTRLIDLSRAAARRLGFTHRGVARVRVAVLHRPTGSPGG